MSLADFKAQLQLQKKKSKKRPKTPKTPTTPSTNDDDNSEEKEILKNLTSLHNRESTYAVTATGKEFQRQLDEQLNRFDNHSIMGMAPFDIVGRGIAGIDELREHLDESKVLFGMIQIEIGSGQFARHKNIFIIFSPNSMYIT